MGSVKVAVRIRPFNGREKDMKATCCLKMQGPQTIITNPETKKDKTFTFDFSWWSHDQFKTDEEGTLIGLTPHYADQKRVFDEVGQEVLDNAYGGFNSTLFAYGQTGAGKSFSMVGYGVNKGIIPIACNEMFKKTESSTNENTKYQIVVTMLEIYNEAIRDLLNPAINPPGGLQVRSKPGVGVYVEGLTPVAVRNYPEIEARMEEGTNNRTVAFTKMNATSSRAHTVFGIIFTTITHDPETNLDQELSARMNLVDLAGSERAESTGATGDRLKEGCAINASLSALGNVISALADKAMGKKKVFIPYRNSALTRLLQDALGGNSKTIMIAALSPADVNYEETLGTLRYADRAKKIKNKVVKMENPTDKIIRLLKEENKRLKEMMDGKGIDLSAAAAGGEGGGGGDEAGLRAKIEAEAKAKYEKQLTENEKMINEMKKSWEEKLKDAGDISSADSSGSLTQSAARNNTDPRLVNLHEDPMFNERVIYPFKEGLTRIGRKTAETKQDVILAGLAVSVEHATVENKGEAGVVITPLNGSKTYVNGDLIAEPVELKQHDRVVIGSNYVFRFEIPGQEAPELSQDARLTAWADAMQEYQEKNGLQPSQSLSTEMNKLEAEAARQREELERKLKRMEENMRKERERAKAALDEQRRKLEAGEEFTEDDRKRLLQCEDEFEEKERGLQAEIERRRELSENIISEQLKRKRETQQIEEELARLMPIINEANQMADELKKNVKFEVRLGVKANETNLSSLEELKNLKTIEVKVRMTHTENGNVWTWSTLKFDSRLYMMRELYQQYSEYGPQETPKAKDPFWDPPEPVEIGKAYVYLKALSQLVEVENSFSIVDYKGEPQGKLEVDIYPEGPDGEELDYLTNPDEILGQDVTFAVRIPHAKELPEQYSNDVYISFNFADKRQETESCDTKTSDPKFKYEAKFRFPSVDEQLRDYLLNEAAVFEVRGFTDPQSQELLEMAEAAGGNAGEQQKKCEQCDEDNADFMCVDCAKLYCNACWALLHRSPSKANHKKKSFNEEPLVGEDMCFQCEESHATVKCNDCDKVLCDPCNELLHKSARKAEHDRQPLGNAEMSEAERRESKDSDVSMASTPDSEAPMCERCEESPANVKCAECPTPLLCEECNELLHRSAKRKNHAREPLAATAAA